MAETLILNRFTKVRDWDDEGGNGFATFVRWALEGVYVAHVIWTDGGTPTELTLELVGLDHGRTPVAEFIAYLAAEAKEHNFGVDDGQHIVLAETEDPLDALFAAADAAIAARARS